MEIYGGGIIIKYKWLLLLSLLLFLSKIDICRAIVNKNHDFDIGIFDSCESWIKMI